LTFVDVVVGGQFGSEAKGTVAARLIDRRGDQLRCSVRVGGPNAGHTVIDHAGNVLRLRQVPVGVIFPDCALAIAAGSEVDFEVLDAELETLEALGYSVRDRLVIDPSATVLEPDDKATEVALELTQRLGSTAKGIGAARANRIYRVGRTIRDAPEALDRGVVIPFARMVKLYDYVCLEGTQGYGLGLHTRYYPFTTSGDCRAIDVLAQVGVSPWDPRISYVQPWVVFRPFPIRVAGNSGPLLDETTWEALGLEPEFTTVTKKMRRVGRWDTGLALEAIRANGTDVSVAITMADQTTGYDLDDIIVEIGQMGAQVRMVGHGPGLPEYTWYPGGKP
jgi:adenylosuccinate synthase